MVSYGTPFVPLASISETSLLRAMLPPVAPPVVVASSRPVVQVNLVFAPLTWLLVGSSTLEFSTLEKAWQSVTRISLGESENFYPQILEAQPTVGPVVVVLYQVLGVVLLLNVVIAVLLQVG